MLDVTKPPAPLPKPAIRQAKIDALQDDPITFFRFCNLHTPHRPNITMAPIGQEQTETYMLFLLKAVKAHRLDPSHWACFFRILDGEFSNWGYTPMGTVEVRKLFGAKQ